MRETAKGREVDTTTRKPGLGRDQDGRDDRVGPQSGGRKCGAFWDVGGVDNLSGWWMGSGWLGIVRWELRWGRANGRCIDPEWFFAPECDPNPSISPPGRRSQVLPPLRAPCIGSSTNSSTKRKAASLNIPTHPHLNGPQPPNSPIRTENTRMPPPTNTRKRNGSAPVTRSSLLSSSRRTWSRGCLRKGAARGE